MAKLTELRARLVKQLGRATGMSLAGAEAKTPSEFLEDVAAKIVATDQHELSCDECAAVLDRFVELAIRGEDVERLFPLVQHHLKMCGECREEYETLLRIVRSDRAAAREVSRDS